MNPPLVKSSGAALRIMSANPAVVARDRAMAAAVEAGVRAGMAEVLARTAPVVPVRMTGVAVPAARVVPEDLAAHPVVHVRMTVAPAPAVLVAPEDLAAHRVVRARMTAGPVPVVQAARARMVPVAPVPTVRVRTAPRASGPRVTVARVPEARVRTIGVVLQAPAGIAAVVLEADLISAVMSGGAAQAALTTVLTLSPCQGGGCVFSRSRNRSKRSSDR